MAERLEAISTGINGACPTILSGSFCQVLVLHLPGVIQRVKGAVAYEKRQLPLSRFLPLGVMFSKCFYVILPVLAENIRIEQDTFWVLDTDIDRQAGSFPTKCVVDDLVTITATAAWSLFQFG